MELYYTCKNCKRKNYLRIQDEDRGQLKLRLGDKITKKCSYCNKTIEYHLNEIKAKSGLRFYIIVIAIGICLIFLAVKFSYLLESGIKFQLAYILIILMPVLILFVLGKTQKEKINRFNSYYV